MKPLKSFLDRWFNWKFEKSKDKRKTRQKKIEWWRNEISQFNFQSDRLGESVFYSDIRPHLKEEIKNKIEKNPRTTYVMGGRGGNYKKQLLLDEIARLEREWDLV